MLRRSPFPAFSAIPVFVFADQSALNLRQFRESVGLPPDPFSLSGDEDSEPLGNDAFTGSILLPTGERQTGS